MTAPTFDKDAQDTPLKQLFPIFTADYDPDASVDDEEQPAADPYDAERIPGEPTDQELQRDRLLASSSDLSVEEQLSQFLREPGDDQADEDPEYRGLSLSLDLGKARDREERIRVNIAQYRLEHPEAAQDA